MVATWSGDIPTESKRAACLPNPLHRCLHSRRRRRRGRHFCHRFEANLAIDEHSIVHHDICKDKDASACTKQM
jgi:hypothetical protein